jgi:hypothetical protein
MKPLSPADAVGPAFSRIRTIFLAPGSAPDRPREFRFWFALKMMLLAALANPGFLGMAAAFAVEAIVFAVVTLGVGLHQPQGFLRPMASQHEAAATALIALAVLVGIVIAVLVIWLWCRLRFAFFDLVLNRRGEVRAAWSGYGPQARRFLLLVIQTSLAFLLLAAVTAGPLIVGLVRLSRSLPQQGSAAPFLLFSQILPIYGLAFLLILLTAVAGAIMEDFLLPSMALENASIRGAFRRFLPLPRNHPWALAFYLLLRLVLQMGITWAGEMAGFLLLFVVALVLGGPGILLYLWLWHLGGAAAMLVVLYGVVAGFVVLLANFLVFAAILGIPTAFVQCYALYLFGGWYAELGSRLDSPPPSAAGTAGQPAAGPQGPAPLTPPLD